ncbi:MAG: hypothetical protein HY914_05250 [Desulfomonile tiedjei]|nr:hypothetical protein [Desulfomonile tiedjei]
MIENDKQRRWWFATHPEYSWSHRGARRRRDVPGRGTQRISGLPAADPKAYDQCEDALDRMDDYVAELHERIRKGDLPPEPDPHTAMDLIPIGRFLMAPVQGVKGLLRSLARGSIVSAVKRGSSGGPGKWVEVGRRGGPSLEHQSRMSRQPIRGKDGKYRINEYEVRVEGRSQPVYFDDFKDGVYYEYKGSYGHLFDSNNNLHPWVEDPGQFRRQAVDQAKAAKGLPVIWRVGPHQVEAFRKAVGDVAGVTIVP